MILNVGCGNHRYGDIRLDLYSGSANILADAQTSLPFKDSTFDLVYSRSFFEHVRDPGLVLVEMFRVLKKDGKVVVITDNAAYPVWHVTGKLGRILGGLHSGCYVGHGDQDKHYALFTLDHLRNHFYAAGFKIIDGPRYVSRRDVFEYTRWTVQRFARILRLAFPFLAPFFYPHILVVGVKQGE